MFINTRLYLFVHVQWQLFAAVLPVSYGVVDVPILITDAF